MCQYYVYAYLDPRKPGKYEYENICFLYEPFYIGKGKGDRYQEHTKFEFRYRSRCNPIKHSIIKNILIGGLDPIIDFPFNNISEQMAFDKEILLIKAIGRRIDKSGKLSNISVGGKGGDNYTMLSDLKKKEISEKLSRSLKGRHSEGYGKKDVYQYSMDGIFIKNWNSISEASRSLKIHKHAIISCCKKNGYKSGGGYLWSYTKENHEIVKSKTRKVVQLSIGGVEIRIWESIISASNELKILPSGISNCCAGRISNSGKYKWKYYEQV